ncbi:MAG TPA: GDSL-type esterase/lipase family protein [Polyangiaceae bacterium]|nr:GDSL-type esterase/lipase family protein [Polyangiaceae bacterium]
MPHPLWSRPSRALLTLALLTALPYLAPPGWPLLPRPGGAPLAVADLRLFDPKAPAEPKAPVSTPEVYGQVELVVPTDDRARADEGPAAPPPPPPAPAAARDAGAPARGEPPPPAFDDPTGRALDPFYEALGRVEAGAPGARARVLYYGDSIVAADWVTSTLRRKLQRRFGDAGHGFVLLANAWAGYSHRHVDRFASEGWRVSRVVGPFAEDGLYGLGGVSFVAEGAGVLAQVGTADAGEIGRAVSRFVVTYVEQPNGGDLALRVDKGEPQIVSTRGPEPAAKAVAVEAPDGPHRLEVRSAGRGRVRVFGVDLERDAPGVIVDALGIVGCRLRFLDKSDDAHWGRELARRAPALVAFAYGANESEDGSAYPMDDYERTARAVYAQARAAVPGAACLIVGPLDRADKEGERYVTRKVILSMNEIQRKLAAELGCAFFDTFRQMGGKGSMGRWIQRGLGSPDLVHPTDPGAQIIGTWLYDALLAGYEGWRARAGASARVGDEFVGPPPLAPAPEGAAPAPRAIDDPDYAPLGPPVPEPAAHDGEGALGEWPPERERPARHAE